MFGVTIAFALAVAGCLSAPADNPIRVDLPVYDQPQEETLGVLLAKPLEPENYGGGRSGNSIGGNAFSQKFITATSLFNPNHAQEVQGQTGSLNVQGADGWFAPQVSTLEGALLETEGLGSKTLTVKENLQNIVAGIFQPKPIVDTITEEEKYGNTGDKFYHAGRAVVGGAEGVSNLVNSALEIPGNIFRKITKAASEKLNNLGGRLIGL